MKEKFPHDCFYTVSLSHGTDLFDFPLHNFNETIIQL